MTTRYDPKIYSPMIKSISQYDSKDSMNISEESEGLRVCIRCLNALEYGKMRGIIHDSLVRCPICGRLQFKKTWCIKKSCYYNFKRHRVELPGWVEEQRKKAMQDKSGEEIPESGKPGEY